MGQQSCTSREEEERAVGEGEGEEGEEGRLKDLIFLKVWSYDRRRKGAKAVSGAVLSPAS